MSLAIELGQTPTQDLINDNKRRLKEERRSQISTEGQEPPPIDEDELWSQMVGGRKKGRIYGRGVVSAYSYLRLIGDVDDDNTTTGPSDLREHVTLLD
ncbi:hypothetical protein PIB30_028951 [Stylosanthes scabra]|uniref:Uncharacterized protein n=1 Tax=Stylosanthes scabra TaxID=79078 RepID=A0ABU6TAU5_9FABA|nr:hypothetical protein [Stylosanthes scabra]